VLRDVTADDLARIPYFRDLQESARVRLAGELAVHTFEPRQLVVVQGAAATGLHYLRTGKGRILRVSVDGREQTLRLIGPGDTFGEVPLFDRGPMPASVETLEASEVIFIPEAVFLATVLEHAAVANALLRHFATRLRGFTEMIEAISLQTVQARLARYLYQLAREEGRTVRDGVIVPREVTQQDLASLIGSVREVVSRTLRTMEEDGLLEIRRSEILIRDLDALRGLL
jgi:CRP-like cAMP-binding protein